MNGTTKSLNREEWHGANAAHLLAAIDLARGYIALAASRSDPARQDSVQRAADRERAARAPIDDTYSLGTLGTIFGLTDFERDVLLLGTSFELEAQTAVDAGQPNPTVGLAIRALPNAQWDAFMESSVLRRFGLIEVEVGVPLTRAQFRVADDVLRYIMGFAAVAPPFPFSVVEQGELPAVQQRVARAAAIDLETGGGPGQPTLVVLHGSDPADRARVAALASGSIGLQLHSVNESDLPAEHAALEALVTLWDRRARLGRAALLIEVVEEGATSEPRGEHVASSTRLRQLATQVSMPLFISSRSAEVDLGRVQSVARHKVSLADAESRRDHWVTLSDALTVALGATPDPESDVRVAGLAEHHRLGFSAIDEAGRRAMVALRHYDKPSARAIVTELGHAAGATSRDQLADLAIPIDHTGGSSLVLPDQERQALDELADHIRLSFEVANRWGMSQAAKGISAMFAGPSGTGKTLAARTVAEEVGLELFRVDLSRLVSKYIGETEKNLKRVFDAARGGGVILLFDEADALFGKRSEVKDSHDRFANVQTAFLLQELEATSVPCLLTTNMRASIDPAFVRRLRFIIDFPFPDEASRKQIWENVFPATVDTEQLRPSDLARLAVSGGTIWNIAARAAFLAVSERAQLTMPLLLRATRREMRKVNRDLAETEIAGWANT